MCMPSPYMSKKDEKKEKEEKAKGQTQAKK